MLLAVLVVCAWVIVRVNQGRWNWRRLRTLHGDEGGSAQSLSFVLTVPFFVMIILFIVQVSQVMIGTVVVHYAAFAAARSAIVWIPARLGIEPENCIGMHEVDPTAMDQVSPSDLTPTSGGLTYLVNADGPKYQKVRAAALMGLASICPSRDVGASTTNTAVLSDAMTYAYQSMAPDSVGIDAVPRRMANKLAYADLATSVEMRFYHRNSDAPHWPPPVTFYQWNGPDAIYFAPNELGWQDDITITVRHQIALLPGPGRLLARLVESPDGRPDEVAARISEQNGVYTYPLKATATLGNEGEISVIPYAY
jgi:hypothetical protein